MLSTPWSSPRSSSSSCNGSTSSPSTTSPRSFFSQCDPYGLDDLREDVARLIERLYTSPYAPAWSVPGNGPTPSSEVVVVEVDRGSASTRGRPPEMTWLIRLRRGEHC